MSTKKSKPEQTDKAEPTEFEKQFEKIKKLLKSIPQSPGVYKMKDDQGTVIYVGKAKNLKSRVAQYFNMSKSHSIKTKKMVEKIHDIDFIECGGEFEALVLETNLIKELRPRYNVLMRDDKSYVYIKVSTNEDFPRLSIVRRRERDGALYFGPKSSQDACEKLFNILRKIFPIRTCTLEMEQGDNGLVQITKRTIPVPCLDYHIKRCAGPCIDKISKEDYNDMMKQIIRFLKGNVQELLTKLKYDMFNFASNKQFEKAAKFRDQIKAIEGMFAKQVVSDPEFVNRDVIGIHPDFDKTFINLFQFRDGKLINQENFTLETPQNVGENDEQQQSSVIESFLNSYYSECTDIPTEIFLREAPLDQKLWEELLTQKRHELNAEIGEDDRKHVKFLTPLIGKKHKILELSEKNAATFAKQSRAKWMSDAQKTSQASRDLAEELGIENELKRIECYDISHMAGEHTTASMVVFIKGSADKKLYRHFKIKTLENGEIDDYAAIEEILSRRLQRLSQFEAPVLDGYHFKKPLKKDWETIVSSLKDEKILKKDESLDSKHAIGLYYNESKENDEQRIVGYATYGMHLESDKTQYLLENIWIEEEHNNRALKHQMWSKLFEKLPKDATHIYVSCPQNQKEDYLSFGFTELKKIPDFLKTTKTPNTICHLIYKLKKASKNSDSSFSQLPELIIVDGGKGQLGVAHQIMQASGLNIPVIGLAKREEEIFMPMEEVPETSKAETGFRRILLPKNSQALYLVQRIRDESHRFANELRKKLGKKQLTESEIDDIPGVGLIIKRRLLKEYGSINAIKAASMEDLERTVGKYIAKMLKEKLGDESGK